MKTAVESKKTIYLKDYKKPTFSIPTLDLTFHLDDEKTIVKSRMHLINNDKKSGDELILMGENLKLISIQLNGKNLNANEYQTDSKTLKIPQAPEDFSLEIEVEINPKANTALDGLYKSDDIFCTQNEPEGFRRITYFADRPDNMSKFTTTIIGDKKKYPYMLSNGNKTNSKDLGGGLHQVTWEDPFLKPCYLFALVAGDLAMIEDTFQTSSGKQVRLEIYSDKGNEERCSHAMKSLKKSMKWDEEVFGLEYDLDIYMIVAVDSFNMGAMENKGLNIFNTSCTLAHPATATDYDFQRVEGVIAHEYFHNWTGNRVTCRDWFQITLKEGLTVFRDQEFSSDMNSRPVKRIEEVNLLRSSQFPEDAGPTSHPIKPESYIQINNFYTATVYNKGAEIIRMIHTLIGKENFRKGIDRYFELFDGQAVTTEDFISSMEQASDCSLSQFKNWYKQAGTPTVSVKFDYNSKAKTFTLHCSQKPMVKTKEEDYAPYFMPFSVALFGSDSKPIILDEKGSKETTLVIKESKQSFTFSNISEKPFVSLNRDFTAPVFVESSLENKDYLFLMAHDNDPFNIWECSQKLAQNFIQKLIENPDYIIPEEYFSACEGILQNASLDEAFKSLTLTLPSLTLLIDSQKPPLFEESFKALKHLRKTIALRLKSLLLNYYQKFSLKEEYKVDAGSIGKRALRNLCLHYLVSTEDPKFSSLAYEQFRQSNNMNDEFFALSVLVEFNCPEKKEALMEFYSKWKDETLVMQKWFSCQSSAPQKNTLVIVKELLNNPVFDIKVPNVMRSVIGVFARNHLCFNAISGEGYEFLAQKILEVDSINPQMGSILAKSFNRFGFLDKTRKEKMQKALESILKSPKLSTNTYEIVSKCLGQ
ncbi:Puromycin-sensitive aminopeptidase [Chlamydiales bacterium SCGC AB-751-O23]|jgi:aminopeptidase N|nr:Puromycin-sensitive aminopeptidase [Chlamydiales bacterium SCGC AB-751-O23]